MLNFKNVLWTLRHSLENLIEEVFEPGTEIGASRVNVTASSYTSTVITGITGGNFLTGLLLLLKADDAMLGMVTMIGFIGNTLQMLSPLVLERFEKRKRILIVGKCVVHLLNIAVIGTISILWTDDRLKITAITAAIMAISLLNAILSPGISIWHIKSIPENRRVKFYSFFNLTNVVIQYAIVLGLSKVADIFKAAGNELLGLMLLRAIALMLAVLDICFLLKVREYPNKREEGALNLKEVLLSPLKQKKYLVTVVIAFLWCFSANIPGPYYTAYLLKDLNIDYSYLNLVNMLNIPLLFIFTPFWSRRIRKTSWFRALCLSMGAYLLNYCGLAFVTKDNLFYLFPLSMILAFIFAPGINIVFANAPFINIPEANQTNYIGFYAAMSNFAAFAGAMLGRSFIQGTEGFGVKVLGTNMQNKQYILLLTAAVMAVSVFIIALLQRRVDSSPSQ